MQLSSYFKVQFTESNLSDEALKIFAEDHLSKLGNCNKPQLTQILLFETREAYLNCYGTRSAPSIHNAAENDRHLLLFHYKQALLKEMRNLNHFINYKFQHAPQIIGSFYPNGVEALHTLSHSEFECALQSFAETLEQQRNNFLPIDIAEFEVLIASYNATCQPLQASLLGIPPTGNNADNLLQLRKQLSRNLLTIAISHLGQPEAVDNYFNTALLHQ